MYLVNPLFLAIIAPVYQHYFCLISDKKLAKSLLVF